jgi:hypothetical protein
MKKSRKSFSLSEAKIQASKLLKALQSEDATKAAKRFQCLPEFAILSVSEILQHDIKRKHALQVIALENGFASWLDLKIQIRFIVGGYLNLWFANYSEAKSHLQQSGGFLLPYKKQFFICNATYLKQIGFDPDDPDWKRIGFDWHSPADKNAWQRLYKKWSPASGGRHE